MLSYPHHWGNVCFYNEKKYHLLKQEKAPSADEVSRTDIVAWCLRNQFELIECDEQKDEDIEDQATVVVRGYGRWKRLFSQVY